MALNSPVAGADWAFASSSGGAAGVSGKPRQTDDHTKHFERAGFEIVEGPACDIPAQSNQADGVAFRITDATDALDDEIKASRPIAVYAGADDDMTLSLGEHFDGSGRLFRAEDEAEGVELRGFAVDAQESGKGVNFSFNRGGRMRDVTVHGVGDSAQEWGCGIYCIVPAGETVVLENVNQPDGARRNQGVGSTHDSIGALLDGRSNGQLVMRECTHGPFPNNSIYASGPRKHGNDGRAIIEDCELYGSDRDQVRVGNDSVVRGCTLYADDKREGFDNLRMVWARYARGVLVEDCMMRAHTSDAAEAIRIDDTAGEVTFRNCDIEIRSPHKAARGVWAEAPRKVPDGVSTDLTIEETRFHGAGSPRDLMLVEGRKTNFDGNSYETNAEETLDIR